jgi:S1-C subfamily serine protease
VEKGMIVIGLEQGGPGERLGLHKGDIVVQLGRFYLSNEDLLGAVLEDVQPGERLAIGIVRGNMIVRATIQARRGDAAPAADPPATRPGRRSAGKRI